MKWLTPPRGCHTVTHGALPHGLRDRVEATITVDDFAGDTGHEG